MSNTTNLLAQGAGKAQREDSISVGAFIASLITAVTCLVIAISIFLILKDRYHEIYQPRSSSISKRLIPSLYPGLSRWLFPLLLTPSGKLLENNEIDAYFFLRFLRLITLICSIATVTIAPVLMSINLLENRGQKDVVSGLDKLSWANRGSSRTQYYWAQLVCTCVIVASTCFMITAEFTHFLDVRQKYLHSPEVNDLQIVLVENIPTCSANRPRLRKLFERRAGDLRAIWVDCKCAGLRPRLQARDKILSKLEAAESRLIYKNVRSMRKGSVHNPEDRVPLKEHHSLPLHRLLPSIPGIGEKVETIRHHREELASLNRAVTLMQENWAPSGNSAILSFSNRALALACCNLSASASPLDFKTTYLETNGSLDTVFWGNLSLRRGERVLRFLVVLIVNTALTLGWVAPIAATGLLAQLSQLDEYFTWAAFLQRLPRWLISLLQGTLPQACSAILMLLFPVVLRQTVKRQRLPSAVQAELAVQSYYFAFLFLHLFLIVSISSGLTAVFYRIYRDVRSASTLLAQNLPKASNYYLSYLVLQAFFVASTLFSQAIPIFGRLIPSLRTETPRKYWMARLRSRQIQWGTTVPVYTNLACIVLAYSAIAPLILPIGLLSFALFWLAYRYSLFYVLEGSLSTGGMFFPRALHQLFTGLYTLELCVIGLFVLERGTSNNFTCLPQASIMSLFGLATILTQRQISRLFEPLFDKDPIHLDDLCPNRAIMQSVLTRPTNGGEGQIRQAALGCNEQVVWIPQDPYGVSDSEVRSTREMYEDIQISNAGAALDESGRMYCGHYPTNPSC